MNIQKTSPSGNKKKLRTVEESELQEMVDGLKIDNLTRGICWIIASVLFLNIAVFLSREPVQSMAQKDIEYHVLTCDINSWAVYAHVFSMFYLDMSRMVREGWIDDDSWIEFTGETVLEQSQVQWRVCDYSYAAEKILINNHTNITMGFLYPEEKWLNDTLEVDWIKDRSFESSSASVLDEDRLRDDANGGYFTRFVNVEWRKQILHRVQGQKVISLMCELMKNRDYTDTGESKENQDLEIPYLRPLGYEQAQETHPTSPERDRDTFEEFFRRLTTGPIANSTFHRTSEFLQFYKDVGKFSEQFIYFTGVLIIALSLAVWVFVSGILLWKLSSMKAFWKRVLQVNVSKLHSLNLTIIVRETVELSRDIRA